MRIEIYLYTFFTLMSIFIFNGVNFNQFMKKNKEIEAKLLVLSLSFGLSYLLTNFVIDFIG
ncbi:MAG: DUF1146 domain-containing protein [Bacilli bacterium]|jgi:uncharacterized membrane protein YwzB|nr:DUF1146 domain-containing protein [Bacilli bacterium]